MFTEILKTIQDEINKLGHHNKLVSDEISLRDDSSFDRCIYTVSETKRYHLMGSEETNAWYEAETAMEKRIMKFIEGFIAKDHGHISYTLTKITGNKCLHWIISTNYGDTLQIHGNDSSIMISVIYTGQY